MRKNNRHNGNFVLVDNDYMLREFDAFILREKGSLKYWRKTFKVWLKSHYAELSEDEIKIYLGKVFDETIKALLDSGEYFEVHQKLKFNLVFFKIKCNAHIPEDVQLETHLKNKSIGPFLCTQSGVILLDELIKHGKIQIAPHSEDYFTGRAIPHELGKALEDKEFNKFLNQVLPDFKDQLLIQEIFGYCLLSDCRFQAAFVFLGEGMNGKSVMLLILRLMLGVENVCSLSLDAIDPTRTFTLAEMVGKLANITEDMNTGVKFAEGIFKMLVAGETIMVERKHKDPFPWKCTTKQIYSTNNMPHVSDKSEGIMRRMVILPFNQIISADRQRKELTDPQFWINTGELPSILSWALDGLQRLIKQNGFTVSPNVELAKKSFRSDANPILIFFEDFVRESPFFESPSSSIYTAYSSWAKANGYHPLSASSFTKEVRRRYPNAQLSQNARAYGGGRTRFWTGIELLISV